MKILIFAGYFYPHKGGSEDHILQFVEKLSKIHKITILTTNTNNSKDYEKINDNLNIFRIPVWNSLGGTYPIPRINKEFKEIFKKLKLQKWDMIMTRTRFWTTSYLGYRLAKKTNTPLIHVEHGSCHTNSNSFIVSSVNKVWDHWIGKKIVKQSKINIGISKGACEFLKHLGAKSPMLFYRGLELKNIRDYRLKKEIENIIFVGRLIYAKGVQDLIQAFSQIDNKNLTLTIVGDGPYKKDLEQLAKKLNLENKIKFLGEKNKEEVLTLLSKSDLFINPSYSEGLPTSVLEAGAVGLPVIATDVGGTREVIINNKTGLLIKEKNSKELKEAIEFMIKNPKKKADFARNLNKLIKDKFDWGKIIPRWEKILKK